MVTLSRYHKNVRGEDANPAPPRIFYPFGNNIGTENFILLDDEFVASDFP